MLGFFFSHPLGLRQIVKGFESWQSLQNLLFRLILFLDFVESALALLQLLLGSLRSEVFWSLYNLFLLGDIFDTLVLQNQHSLRFCEYFAILFKELFHLVLWLHF